MIYDEEVQCIGRIRAHDMGKIIQVVIPKPGGGTGLLTLSKVAAQDMVDELSKILKDVMR